MRRQAAIVVVAACLAAAGCSTQSLDSPGAQGTVSTQPGDTADPAIQALADACVGGSGDACDQLWSAASVGSEFEQLGASCGGRLAPSEYPVFGNCAEVLRGAPAPETTAASGEEPPPPTAGEPAPLPPISIDVTVVTVTPLTPGTILVRPADLVTPAEGSWIVIVASLEVGGVNTVARAASEAASLREKVDVGSEFFLSSDAESLNPGFWVVYSGPFDTADDARSSCKTMLADRIVNDCYARLVEGVTND